MTLSCFIICMCFYLPPQPVIFFLWNRYNDLESVTLLTGQLNRICSLGKCQVSKQKTNQNQKQKQIKTDGSTSKEESLEWRDVCRTDGMNS